MKVVHIHVLKNLQSTACVTIMLLMIAGKESAACVQQKLSRASNLCATTSVSMLLDVKLRKNGLKGKGKSKKLEKEYFNVINAPSNSHVPGN